GADRRNLAGGGDRPPAQRSARAVSARALRGTRLLRGTRRAGLTTAHACGTRPQQFLQMLGIGPNGSGSRLASSSFRTEGGSDRSVGCRWPAGASGVAVSVVSAGGVGGP